ncbi:ATP-dependent DNA helicase [Gemmiger formicilis]
MPAARLPCSPCQGASGKFGKLLLLFSFFYDLNNVLMSNPCGAVQQAAAPHYFAINRNGTGGFRLNETMPTGYELAHQQAETIFRHVFPRQGMTVREGQIQLCHTMLDALFGREVALCDAGVGLGKTYAYLVAAILWMRQRALPLRQPLVISTASVALQDAILKEYIPFLSSILIQFGYVEEPIQTVLRKGKGRYVCDLRLLKRQRELVRRGEEFARRLRVLRGANSCLDLDQIQGLSGYDRRHICVPERCERDCLARQRCRYQRYLHQAAHGGLQIQICNHNYLLADAIHRQNGWNPLLRDYGALIIDEAHKLPEVNQQMQTQSLSVADLYSLSDRLARENLIHDAQLLRRTTKELVAVFDDLRHGQEREIPYVPQQEQLMQLNRLEQQLREYIQQNCGKLSRPLQRALHQTAELAQRFLRPDDHSIRYVEFITKSGEGEKMASLNAVPKDLPECLYNALWSRGKTAILTSGTLAAGDRFSNTKRQLGLECGVPIRTLRVSSPFHYQQNCLLVFPGGYNAKARGETNNVQGARLVKQLVEAANGHALVLFTSYEQMGVMYETLKQDLKFAVLQARRGSQTAVEQFKQMPNGVLLAGGPCWEGMDFPGDMVSLLVIVSLPFPVPDPVREARRAQYADLHTYIQAEIVPEMQQKLRQGFGRAIRSETDSCAVAILDPRAEPGGRYHQAVLDALPPDIPVTTKIEDIEPFLRAHKSPDYFLPDHD